MTDLPKYPWRLDTNERYREVVRLLMSLATASLLLPVFFARDFLKVGPETALADTLTPTAYWSWVWLGTAIVSGVFFHFFSAKWVRLAWNQPVTVFRISAGDKAIERGLDITFWGTVLGFLGGAIFLLIFVLTYKVGI